MFEILVSLCLAASQPSVEGACRQVLLPGYETADPAACKAALDSLTLAPDWPEGQGMEGQKDLQGAQSCVPSGPALDVQEIAPGVFVHSGAVAEPDPLNAGDVSNSGFVIGETSVAVIDAGGSRQVGEKLYRAIRQRTDLPVSHLILTHMHPDHVLGASVFREAGADITGHPALARALEDRAASYLASFGRLIGENAFIGTRIILPGHEPGTPLSDIDLGGRKLRLAIWPLAHSPVDLTVYDEMSGTLFAGDLVFDRHTPALDGSVTGWLKVLDQLETLPVKHLVPGHGAAVLPHPDGLNSTRRYLELLARDSRAAIAAGEPLSTAARHIGSGEAENWALFDLFNPRNATAAYSELEWE